MTVNSKAKETHSKKIANVLGMAAAALAEGFSQAAGCHNPEEAKQELMRALDDHAGFGRVVREWHAYHLSAGNDPSKAKARAKGSIKGNKRRAR
ncbi:MAG: hypothetical protein ACREKE_06745 [bacterium]